MTTLRSRCPHCGDDVDLAPAQITLHLPAETATASGRYAFTCPQCADLAVKPADPRTVELLLLGEVPVSTAVTAPWEVLPDHPERPVAAPALTSDDLIAFHELLERDDWFDEFRAA